MSWFMEIDQAFLARLLADDLEEMGFERFNQTMEERCSRVEANH